jgi:hypothetical protein
MSWAAIAPKIQDSTGLAAAIHENVGVNCSFPKPVNIPNASVTRSTKGVKGAGHIEGR